VKKQRISRNDRKILPLLLRIIRRCKKCRIVGILKKCCPLPLSQDLNVVHSKLRLDNKRKHPPSKDAPICKKARLFYENGMKRVKCIEGTDHIVSCNEPLDHSKELLARLVRCYCRPRHVTRFLTSLCSFIIPKQLWGTTKNRNTFYKWLAQLVRLRKDDELSILQLMEAMDFHSVPWIASKNNNRKAALQQYRPQRFYLFLHWIIHSIIRPILTACFHSTDSEVFRKRILHYRVDVWRSIENLFHSSLHASCSFQRYDRKVQTLFEDIVTFSQLRLLPKASGLRKIQIPIKSSLKQLQARIGFMGNSAHGTTNHVLSNIQAVMEFERRRNSSFFASCVLSIDEIYLAWLKLKHQWKAAGKPSMYMAAVDISNAFDTIQLDFLIEKILPELFQEDEYVILRYCATFSTHSKPVVTKYERVVCNDPMEESHFLLLCRNKIANKFRTAIITDQVSRIVLARETILKVLRQRLMNNVVLFRNGLYLQKQGIPQGMTLSSRIASLYYGHFERHCLRPHHRSPSAAIEEPDKEQIHLSLRLVDDFLYINSDRNEITRFLQVMNHGSPLYGLCINPSKTRTFIGKDQSNEDNLCNEALRENITQVPWCGLVIHCRSLEITVDYSRYFESSIYDTLSFKASESCTEILVHRSQQVFSMKVSASLIFYYANSFVVSCYSPGWQHQQSTNSYPQRFPSKSFVCHQVFWVRDVTEKTRTPNHRL